MLSSVSIWMGDPSWSRGDWVGRAHGGYHQIQYYHYPTTPLSSTEKPDIHFFMD